MSENTANTQLDLFTNIANHSGAFGRLGLGIANRITDFAFETAKLATRAGLGISKTVVERVGINSQILDIAEFFALLGIEIGHNITSFSLKGSTEIVKVIQETFGDKESLEMAIEFGKLLQREFERTGQQIGYFDMWRCFSAWIALHKSTLDLWAADYVFSKVSPKVIENKQLGRYLRFANAAYGQQAIQILGNEIFPYTSDKKFYANYCGIPEYDVLYHSVTDSETNLLETDYSPTYYLSLDQNEKQIVLSFRGTLSPRDVIVDLACEPINLELDKTVFELHGGMLRVATKLADQTNPNGLFQRVRQLMSNYPDYGLILTGHSLGAGIASILGMLWTNPSTGRTKPDSGLPDRTIHVYAFACPSVMDIELGNLCQSFITTCVIGWDWLARISLSNVLEIRDAVIWLHQHDAIEPELVHSILSKSLRTLTDLEVLEFYQIRKQIIEYHTQECKSKLFPPGDIIWIHNDNTYMVQDRQSVFGELVFTRNNFYHHLPLAYEDALNRL